jgi:hypothetical protein
MIVFVVVTRLTLSLGNTVSHSRWCRIHLRAADVTSLGADDQRRKGSESFHPVNQFCGYRNRASAVLFAVQPPPKTLLSPGQHAETRNDRHKNENKSARSVAAVSQGRPSAATDSNESGKIGTQGASSASPVDSSADVKMEAVTSNAAAAGRSSKAAELHMVRPGWRHMLN